MSPANAKMFEWTKAAGGALGLDIRWQDTGGVCEGNNLWAAGCPNGQRRSMHSLGLTDAVVEGCPADENLALDHLRQAVGLWP